MSFALTLNDLVTIQTPATGQDAIGAPAAGWQDFDVNVWANIKHQSGAQAINGGAETSAVKASIRLRYRTDLNAGMRVLFGAIAYDIKAVLPEQSKKIHVDLVCEVVS